MSKLEDIQARAEKATKGPWALGRLYGQHLRHGEMDCAWCGKGLVLVKVVQAKTSNPRDFTDTVHYHYDPNDDSWRDIVSLATGDEITGNYDYEAGGVASTEEDARFIAHTREDIPYLIAELLGERERCAAVAERTRGTGRAIAAAIRNQG